MDEYKTIVEKYYDTDDKALADEYCKKFWLDSGEYKKDWKPIQDTIFNSSAKSISDGVIKTGFFIIPFIGGGVFSEEEFVLWKECMQHVGDSEFVVVQSRMRDAGIRVWDNKKQQYKDDHWHHFKFSVDVTWKEITSGGIFSEEMICSPMREWFIFGDSGMWGRYDANEHDSPIDIIGVHPTYEDFFSSKLQLDEKFKNDVKKYIPDVYKKWIDW